MDKVDITQFRQQFEDEVRRRMPGAPIERIEVLQHGDSPEIEPGELLAQVVIDVHGDEDERERVFEAFHNEYRAALDELRRHLDKLSTNMVLAFVEGGEEAAHGPHHVIKLGPGPGALAVGQSLTPVMARLGDADLETLDTLIAAGIAGSRAEGVRWALARIRERPAYEQIREHARQIETLKSQF